MHEAKKLAPTKAILVKFWEKFMINTKTENIWAFVAFFKDNRVSSIKRQVVAK